MPDDPWLPVWSALSDESLEDRLRHYLWLSHVDPVMNQRRYEHLVAEAERRGKPEIVERAKQWVRSHEMSPPLQ
jgi:hypothetical protein